MISGAESKCPPSPACGTKVLHGHLAKAGYQHFYYRGIETECRRRLTLTGFNFVTSSPK